MPIEVSYCVETNIKDADQECAGLIRSCRSHMAKTVFLSVQLQYITTYTELQNQSIHNYILNNSIQLISFLNPMSISVIQRLTHFVPRFLVIYRSTILKEYC